MRRIGMVVGATWALIATAGEFTFSPDDHSGLTEETFALVRNTKGDWEMLR